MHCENFLTGTVMYFTFQQSYLLQEGQFLRRANSTKTNKANCTDLLCAIFVILFTFLSKLPFTKTFRPRVKFRSHAIYF